MSTWSRRNRRKLWSSDATTCFFEAPIPYGPGHISYPAFVEINNSSRSGPPKSFFKIAPRFSSALPLGGSVHVRQVEVSDSPVERVPNDGAAIFKDIYSAEVLPEPQRNGRQHQAAFPAAAKFCALVSLLIRFVSRHFSSLSD